MFSRIYFEVGRTFRGTLPSKAFLPTSCGVKAQSSRRKGQRVKDKERGLWNVGCGTLFSRMILCVSGEHFAEHCAFEGVSPDDDLSNQFALGRENISLNRDVGCGTQGRGT